MSADEAGRPAASPERVLAAVVFALVSLLLVVTLPWETTTAGNGAGSAASRPASRP